ncbi:MAG: hypothetical protein H0Z39_04000 [Peptococcaceae bacterium]|nr:hypothetical protein [Peptococcaceae bacterium]
MFFRGKRACDPARAQEKIDRFYENQENDHPVFNRRWQLAAAVTALVGGLALFPVLENLVGAAYAGLLSKFLATGLVPLLVVLWVRPRWFWEKAGPGLPALADAVLGLIVAGFFVAADYFTGGSPLQGTAVSHFISAPGWSSVFLFVLFLLVYGALEVLFILFLGITAQELSGRKAALFFVPFGLWGLARAVGQPDPVLVIVLAAVYLLIILGLYRYRPTLWGAVAFWTVASFFGI